MQWLTAVELGLLKGRHPLLTDVDVTINPSKGLSLVESGASNRNGRANKLLNLPSLATLDVNSVNHLKDMFEGDSAANLQLRSKNKLKGDLQFEINGLQPENKNSLEQSSAIDAQLVEDEVANPVESERGQVLQTAEVVMNMLDVTMPETLTEEQKKKVMSLSCLPIRFICFCICIAGTPNI